jgi:hypothetical protein
MYEFGDRSSFCPLLVNITSKLEGFLEWGGKRKIDGQRGWQYIIGLPASHVFPTALMNTGESRVSCGRSDITTVMGRESVIKKKQGVIQSHPLPGCRILVSF